VRLAETLAAYERGEINVLINAQLLAEGWNSPRATGLHAPRADGVARVYQQRIGRIMRLHPRKEAGIVVDFVPKGATHNERVVSLHSLSTRTSTARGARHARPAPPLAAPRPAAAHARRRGSCPVTQDVRGASASSSASGSASIRSTSTRTSSATGRRSAGRQIRFDERADVRRRS
jgi:superfamily II DNA or RNA helicase